MKKKKSQSEKELYHDLEKGKTTETSNNGWLLRVWGEEGKVEYMKHKEYFMCFYLYDTIIMDVTLCICQNMEIYNIRKERTLMHAI